MFQLLVFRVSRGCCTSQGDDAPSLEKCLLYSSKDEIKKFFIETFDISEQSKKCQEVFWKRFEKNWNVGMSHSDGDFDDECCRDCGFIYVYGEAGKIDCSKKRLVIQKFEGCWRLK